MKKKEDSGGLPPVAIIGIGCMFPQAGDAEEFWSNIKGGVDAITGVPASHWSAGGLFRRRPQEARSHLC